VLYRFSGIAPGLWPPVVTLIDKLADLPDWARIAQDLPI